MPDAWALASPTRPCTSSCRRRHRRGRRGAIAAGPGHRVNPDDGPPDGRGRAGAGVGPPWRRGRVPDGFLDALPRLQLVQLLSAGAEQFVGRLPDGVCSATRAARTPPSTAEWAVAATLAAQRGLPSSSGEQEAGRWSSHTAPLAGRRPGPRRRRRRHRADHRPDARRLRRRADLRRPHGARRRPAPTSCPSCCRLPTSSPRARRSRATGSPPTAASACSAARRSAARPALDRSTPRSIRRPLPVCGRCRNGCRECLQDPRRQPDRARVLARVHPGWRCAVRPDRQLAFGPGRPGRRPCPGPRRSQHEAADRTVPPPRSASPSGLERHGTVIPLSSGSAMVARVHRRTRDEKHASIQPDRSPIGSPRSRSLGRSRWQPARPPPEPRLRQPRPLPPAR